MSITREGKLDREIVPPLLPFARTVGGWVGADANHISSSIPTFAGLTCDRPLSAKTCGPHSVGDVDLTTLS